MTLAKEAGLETRKEPDTYSLLLGEFSKKECQRVFPKRVDKAYKTSFEDLSQAVDFTSSAGCTLTLNRSNLTSKTKLISFLFLLKTMQLVYVLMQVFDERRDWGNLLG